MMNESIIFCIFRIYYPFYLSIFLVQYLSAPKILLYFCIFMTNKVILGLSKVLKAPRQPQPASNNKWSQKNFIQTSFCHIMVDLKMWQMKMKCFFFVSSTHKHINSLLWELWQTLCSTKKKPLFSVVQLLFNLEETRIKHVQHIQGGIGVDTWAQNGGNTKLLGMKSSQRADPDGRQELKLQLNGPCGYILSAIS